MSGYCVSCNIRTCRVRTEPFINKGATKFTDKPAKPKKLKIKLPKTPEDFIIITRSNEAAKHPDKLCFRIVDKATQSGYPVYYNSICDSLYTLTNNGITIRITDTTITYKTIEKFLERLGDTIVIKTFTGPQRALLAKSLAKVRNKQQPGCKNYLISAITELATLLIPNRNDRDSFIRECMSNGSNTEEAKENPDDSEPA